MNAAGFHRPNEAHKSQGLVDHQPKGRPMKRSILFAIAMFLSASAVRAATFTPCGASGDQGPTQSMCNTAYGGAVSVSVSGGIQTWTVPATGTYRITATGAQGASAQAGQVGGRGARIVGEVSLTAGQTLKLAVGQQGSGQSSDSNGGGGGGSFVVSSADVPLLIAGGGGGTRTSAEQDGCDASITQFAGTGSGDSATSSCSLKASDAGQGGIVSSDSWGSAGAGFNSDGATDRGTHGGGYAWLNGMLGGASDYDCSFAAVGGFGGGGDGRGCDGGGGGGGYSGGDGGYIAGGGGSYNTGSNPSATAGVGTGDGSIVIETLLLPTGAPTLSAFGMILLFGLLALVGVAKLGFGEQ
jgi:hypothetical protein